MQPRPRHTRATFALLLASTVGFSTIENFGYVLISPLPSMGVKLFVALQRVLLSTPLHVVATAFTATRLSLFDLETASGGEQRTCVAVQAIWPAVLIHGTFDFVAFLAPLVAAQGLTEEEEEEEGGKAVRRAITAFAVVLLVAIVILLVSYWQLREQFLLLVDREDAYYAHKACVEHPAHPVTEQLAAAARAAGRPDPTTTGLSAVQGTRLGTIADAATALPAGNRRRVAALRAMVHPMDVRFGEQHMLGVRQQAAAPYVSTEQSAAGAFMCWGYTEERTLFDAAHGQGGGVAEMHGGGGGGGGGGVGAGDIEMQLTGPGSSSGGGGGGSGSGPPAGGVATEENDAALGLLTGQVSQGDHRKLSDAAGAL